MLALKRTAIGTSALLVILAVTGLLLGIVGDARGWGSLTIGIGPVPIWSFWRAGQSFETTLGWGMPVLSLAGGILNAVAGSRLDGPTKQRAYNG